MASPAPAEHATSEPFASSRGYEPAPPVAIAPPTHHALPRELPVPDEAQVESELTRIETLEMSDVDGPGFEADKEEYIQRGRKRALEADDNEGSKRKVSLHKQHVRHELTNTL
jgi:DNA helicase INO80